MKIAFVTPLSPDKTGIADFCEEILPLLKKYFEIDIFSSHIKPANEVIANNFDIYLYDDLEKDDIRKKYDRIIYQIGNNEEHHGRIYELALKYKGIVELHDVSIEGLIWGMTLQYEQREKYLEIVEYCHGINARMRAESALNGESMPLWDEPLQFPLNKQIIDSAEGIIVHSDLGFEIVKGINRNMNVARIYLHTNELYNNYEELKFLYKRELGLKKERLVFASFGFGTKTKRIPEILEALGRVKKQGYDFEYIIVGKIEKDINIDKFIKKYNLEDNVVVTGYVSLEDLKKYMLATDICMSLRYPSHGESSAILHRALGMGKCVVLTNEGTFSEYPDDVCLKIDMENEIENIISTAIKIINKDINLKDYEKKSLQYAKDNFNIEENVLMYKSFMECTDQRTNTRQEDILAEYLYQMKIYDLDIINKLF